MIIRPRPNAFTLFLILRGSVLLTILPRLLFVTAFACAVTWLDWLYPAPLSGFSTAPFALLGIALSIFLGFRNSVCYDRWWEGRKLWGQLVLEMRSYARSLLVLLSEGEAVSPLQRRLVFRGIGFAHGLAARLRGRDVATSLEPWLVPENGALTLPAGCRNANEAVLRAISAELAAEMRAGRLTDILYKVLDDRVTAFSGIQAACERILGTPTPFAYSLLLHRTAILFCLLVPFGLVGTLGFATPLATALLAYAYFGLDALGDELEEPFGLTHNDLALDALVRVIEIDLKEAIGAPDVPEPLKPVRFVLT
ncbi:bestrophin family protein [Radicibacter daui]|uniref:bestrophin family protein n=1 Tax=Radicibacter daui TaxID=3064829 RepID=UPI0040469392